MSSWSIAPTHPSGHKHLCADAGYTEAPALKVIEKHGYAPHVKASGAMGGWVLARLSEQTTAACR